MHLAPKLVFDPAKGFVAPYFQLSLDKQANIGTIFFLQKRFIFSISLACLPKGRNKYSVESNVRA